MIVPLFLDTNDCRYFSKNARQAIEEVCATAKPEIRTYLGELNLDIELACQTGEFVIPETGEIGTAITPTRVGWTVDPKLPGGVAGVARTQLRFTLFHELHHLVRGWVVYGGPERSSFMEGVVSEGLATVFERDFAQAAKHLGGNTLAMSRNGFLSCSNCRFRRHTINGCSSIRMGGVGLDIVRGRTLQTALS